MWSISEVKAIGKSSFKANYWPCVLAAFLMSLFTGGSSARASSETQQVSSDSLSSLPPEQQAAVVAAFIGAMIALIAIFLIIKIFLANPIELGGTRFFKENIEQTPAPLAVLKTGFQNYGHTFVTMFLRDLYIVLWMLLLIVPGLIKAYSYRMVPYILAENPDMPANEIITRSREMMNGHKWQSFLLDLSFIGWIILGVLTLGLGMAFWTAPYMQSTDAALYLKLKQLQATPAEI